MKTKKTSILAIESSCDETAAAVIVDGKVILSNVINSQVKLHEKFGGVVPELASRKHIEAISAVVDEALSDAKMNLDDITAIAVTAGPGLIGSLLVGISFAKALAFSKNIPLIGVNHLKGHIFAAMLENDISFPFISLLVSGGHTELYLIHGPNDIKLLGKTRDDAAGEAFDKASKIIGRGYPGGIVIDNLSKSGDEKFHKFPRSIINKNTFDFSFSGLKTSFKNYISNKSDDFMEKNLNSVVASFQEAIVDVLLLKSFNAVEKYGVKNMVVSGGVAANSRLREQFLKRGKDQSVNVFIPSKILCTDNAAMIGMAGFFEFNDKNFKDIKLNAFSRANLGVATP
ncbi:tRNA (adenosine(37)-N6)-threonylcarbamoyltransferase complex transferase subunit TsaD [Thermodesulfobacteriota bacterium]